LLLPAMHGNRAHIDFDPQVLDPGERACNFLAPGVSLTIDASFLRGGERRKPSQQ
jgi:hypothetical protein